MQVPIISGVVTTESGDFLTSYPVNLEPVLRDTGLSAGYLSHGLGIMSFGTGPGADRGGIAWNGICYRVMGTRLVRVSSTGAVTDLGNVGSGGTVNFDYSFDNLIINSGTNLFYWNEADGLRQVTDPDLGDVLDAIFVDGYTMTTDGEFLVVTDLNDPMSVDPLKYGSSEESPDAIRGLFHIHGEVVVPNRFTTQIFQNVGGNGFPFQTVKTATVPYGCVGPHAKCEYAGTMAFVGSGDNSAPGVYLLGAGDASKISSAEVDLALAALTEEELVDIWIERRVWSDDERLIVHLPDRSWSFSAQVSKKSSVKTWCQYVTSTGTSGVYEGRGIVYAYGKMIVGSSTGQIGYLSPDTAQHYGTDVGWQFDTTLLYNETRKAILNSIELVGTPGRGNSDSRIFWSYTKDGETWSVERATSSGTLGQRSKRPAWRFGTRFENYMGLRFRGVDASLMAMARLEAEIEPLNA